VGGWVYKSEVMWSVVMWSEMACFVWSNFILKWSEVKWSEVSYGEVLGDKSTMYIRVTLYWGYLIILWPFHLGESCIVVVLTYFVTCGCSGSMCNCIDCVLYCLYCVFLYCFIYVYLFLFVLSVLV